MLTRSHHECSAVLYFPEAAKKGATLGCAESRQIMGQQKPLGLAIVQEWLAAWDESNIFSDAAVRHLKSLITDPFCAGECYPPRPPRHPCAARPTENSWAGKLIFFWGIFRFRRGRDCAPSHPKDG
jgi:hypothetical protein